MIIDAHDRTRFRRGVFAAGFAAALLAAAAPARADVLSEMETFWQGALVNVTGPGAFEGQASGHWTLGNLYMRAPQRYTQFGTLYMPSIRAGCGGIDIFAGAFSFIDSDQLIAFGRAIAQNAAGFAFELALETISPVIAETMSKLRALAQWINNQNMNSCETAQALVGSVWSKNDRASAAICAAVGTSQGLFADYAAARHGCGAGGRRNSTVDRAEWPLFAHRTVNINYAWHAAQMQPVLHDDLTLREFAMTVSGTIVVTAPTNDANDEGPRVRMYPGLALDRTMIEVLMEGGGQIPMYRCSNYHRCLEVQRTSHAIPTGQGFRDRVRDLLRRLAEAVRNDTAPPPEALGLVNITTLPVYRIINASAAYRGAVIDQEIEALSEAVAIDVLLVWLSDIHRAMERSSALLMASDGAQLEEWRTSLRANRAALGRYRSEGLSRYETALSVVEKLRLIETELAGALSADLRAALAFSRGAGSAAASR